MIRENPISGDPTKGENIDVHEGGGSSRSSDEVLVRAWSEGDESARGELWANQWTGRSPISLRRLEAERPQENGWHEPYELRGSCTVL
jgi:hypothetical protein